MSDIVFSRRSVCVSGGGFALMGLSGCDNPSGSGGGSVAPYVEPVVNAAVSIFFSRFLPPFRAAIASSGVSFLIGSSGLYDTNEERPDKPDNPWEELSVDEEKYDSFRRVPGVKHALFDEALPSLNVEVKNETSDFLDLALINLVLYSPDNVEIERKVADQLVYLNPGQSTRLDQTFSFEKLNKRSLGYVALELGYEGREPVQSRALLGIAPKRVLAAR